MLRSKNLWVKEKVYLLILQNEQVKIKCFRWIIQCTMRACLKLMEMCEHSKELAMANRRAIILGWYYSGTLIIHTSFTHHLNYLDGAKKWHEVQSSANRVVHIHGPKASTLCDETEASVGVLDGVTYKPWWNYGCNFHYAHTQTQTHTQTKTQTHRHTQTQTHTNTDRHRQTHIHTDTHRHTDTHTHTHTHTLELEILFNKPEQLKILQNSLKFILFIIL